MKIRFFILFIFFSCSCSACSIEDVLTYLSGFTTMSSDFVQHDSGVESLGLLLISKPFHARWEYHSPDQIIINSNSSFTTYYDKDLDQSFSVFTDNNITSLLYDDLEKIKNSKFFCQSDKAFLQIDRKEAIITLKFSTKPFELEGLEIVHKEAPDNITSIDFFNMKYNIPIKASIFSSFD